MFTGIVAGRGTVLSHERIQGRSALSIELPVDARGDLEVGASIALDGVCLTVVAFDQDRVDISSDRRSTTTLGSLIAGQQVNVERAARFGDEIGGHELSGHIPTTATVEAVSADDGNHVMSFALDPEWMRFILEKGYIAVDGCSLTVVSTTEQSFEIWLIPETLDRTGLGDSSRGRSRQHRDRCENPSSGRDGSSGSWGHGHERSHRRHRRKLSS